MLLGPGPSSWEKTQFFYDNRGRLIREWRSGQDEYTTWNTYDLRYTYDQVGNRLSTDDVQGHKDVTYTYDVENPGLYGSCSNRLMTYFIDDEYDTDDEQVWYTYDDNGNVTRIVRRYADDDQYRSTWLVYGRGGQVRYVIGETWNADDLDWWIVGDYVLNGPWLPGLPCGRGGQRARGHDVQAEIGDPESLGLGL